MPFIIHINLKKLSNTIKDQYKSTLTKKHAFKNWQLPIDIVIRYKKLYSIITLLEILIRQISIS